MIAAMLKHFKPRMAPPKFCHPGLLNCRLAAFWFASIVSRSRLVSMDPFQRSKGTPPLLSSISIQRSLSLLP